MHPTAGSRELWCPLHQPRAYPCELISPTLLRLAESLALACSACWEMRAMGPSSTCLTRSFLCLSGGVGAHDRDVVAELGHRVL
eukprot:1408661-Alexandrium_andersonii.AAC.1